MKSIVTVRPTPVTFPEFLAERIYMREFTKKGGLPQDIKRWQRTVDAMLDGIDAPGPIYLMVDQKEVPAGYTHRRGGVHIDGYWVPAKQAWDQPGPSWLYGHHGHGGHGFGSHIVEPRSGHRIPGERGHRIPVEDTPRHRFADAEWPAEAIVLASDVQGCRAFEGEFDGGIGSGGSCDHIDLSKTNEIVMQPGVCYAGNVTMLHESIPLKQSAKRTVVRLNIPGWSP